MHMLWLTIIFSQVDGWGEDYNEDEVYSDESEEEEEEGEGGGVREGRVDEEVKKHLWYLQEYLDIKFIFERAHLKCTVLMVL